MDPTALSPLGATRVAHEVRVAGHRRGGYAAPSAGGVPAFSLRIPATPRTSSRSPPRRHQISGAPPPSDGATDDDDANAMKRGARDRDAKSSAEERASVDEWSQTMDRQHSTSTSSTGLSSGVIDMRELATPRAEPQREHVLDLALSIGAPTPPRIEPARTKPTARTLREGYNLQSRAR